MKKRVIIPVILVVFVLAVLVFFAYTRPSRSDKSVLSLTPLFIQLQEFNHFAKEVQERYQVPGMAIAIVKNGKVVFDQGFGKRNTKGDPVTPETRFPINGLTKTFTATLEAMQIDRGKYAWNTSVVKLDPFFRLHGSEVSQTMAVKDLIAGNSGLPANTLNVMRRFGYTDGHLLSVLHFIRQKKPFPAQYAPQPALLAESKKILEMQSGLSYQKLLDRNIFKPLQMKRSVLRTFPALQKTTNIAQPFRWYGSGAYRYKFKNYPYASSSPYLTQPWALNPGVANDGIYSTTSDMAKWLLFNLDQGDFKGHRLVSLKNMQFLLTPQTTVQTSWKDKVPKKYGQGWFLDQKTYAPDRVLFQSSSRLGSEALMAILPSERLGIVILTNQDRAQPAQRLLQRFLNLTFGRPKRPLPKASANWGMGMGLGPACLVNRNLHGFVGRYWNPIYGVVNVRLKKGAWASSLSLDFGPKKTVWSLFNCFGFRANWHNPNGMTIPMIPRNLSSVDFNKLGTRMTLQYLNQDGGGVFKRLAPASTHPSGH